MLWGPTVLERWRKTAEGSAGWIGPGKTFVLKSGNEEIELSATINLIITTQLKVPKSPQQAETTPE